MPDNQDRSGNRFSRYDAMSTEALQARLREDASKPMGEESDTEEILYVMEVLAGRRKEHSEGKDPAQALASFKNNYCTENKALSLSERAPAVRKRNRSGLWKRGLAAAVAAVFLLVVGNSITASAIGFDLFAVIAKWTQETFHFGEAGQPDGTNAPSPDFAHPCASLKDALIENEVTLAVLPTWMPEGFIERDVKIQHTPKQRMYQAKYQNGDDTIVIRIAEYLNASPMQIEQSEALIENYLSNGILYYIFENRDMLKAVWIRENLECYISGPVSLATMKEIIDSIEKG